MIVTSLSHIKVFARGKICQNLFSISCNNTIIIIRMGCSKTLRIILLTVIICILVSHRQYSAKASPPNVGENNHVTRNRANRFSARLATQYTRGRQEPDFLVDDDDLFDLNKRQSDDYGHMRFGKREFDDYGHMRFGRSGSD